MKKVLLIAAAMSVLAIACTKTEVVSVSDGNMISFDNAFVGNSTKAGLATAEQYGASNLPPQFFVYANTAADAAVFSGEKVYLSNGSWVYDNLVKWENGNTYKFAAYAVKDAEGLPAANGTASFNYDSHTLAIDGYVSNDKYQTDLLLATSTQNLSSANEPVVFNFKHALSMIKFTFKSGLGGDNPITISNFKIADVKTTGNVSVNNNTVSWTDQAEEAAPVDFTDNDWTELLNSDADGVASDEFVVIPQGNATVTVTFDATIGEDPAKTLKSEITLDATGWEAGKRYNYTATITASDLDYIEFGAPTVEDWGDYNNADSDLADAE